MNVHYLFSLLAVVVLGLVAYVGAGAAGLQAVFGIFIPYLALIVFLIGFINRVLVLGKIPGAVSHPHHLRPAAIHGLDQTIQI